MSFLFVVLDSVGRGGIAGRLLMAVLCALVQVSYVDFEGLSDGESMKRILANVKPRSLVRICPSPCASTSAMLFPGSLGCGIEYREPD